MKLMAQAVLVDSLLLFAATGVAETGTQSNGIAKVESPYSVNETADRFEAAVAERGIKVFSRFDHAGAATEYERELLPLITINFGNPRYGTSFMVSEPQAGIDFPPKAVVYEDAEGQVWLAYNTSDYLYLTIFKRHGLEFPADHVSFYAGVLDELVSATVAE